jgi:hypothetical protein
MHQTICGETHNKTEIISKNKFKNFIEEAKIKFDLLEGKNVVYKNKKIINSNGLNYLNISNEKKEHSHFKAIIRKEFDDCEKKYPYLGDLFLNLLFEKKIITRNINKKLNKQLVLKFANELKYQENKDILKAFIKNCSLAHNIIVEKTVKNNVYLEKNNEINFKNVIDFDFFNAQKNYVFKNFKFLIVDGFIESLGEINHLLEISSQKKNTDYIIFCFGMSLQVKNTIKINNIRKNTRIFPISFTVNEENINILNDISLLLDEEIISANKGQTISQSVRKKLKTGKELKIINSGKTFSLAPVCNHKAIKSHILFLKNKVKETNEVNSSYLLKRIKTLSMKNFKIYLPESLLYETSFTRELDYWIRFLSNSNKKFILLKNGNHYIPLKYYEYAKEKSQNIKKIINNIEKIIMIKQ